MPKCRFNACTVHCAQGYHAIYQSHVPYCFLLFLVLFSIIPFITVFPFLLSSLYLMHSKFFLDSLCLLFIFSLQFWLFNSFSTSSKVFIISFLLIPLFPLFPLNEILSFFSSPCSCFVLSFCSPSPYYLNALFLCSSCLSISISLFLSSLFSISMYSGLSTVCSSFSHCLLFFFLLSRSPYWIRRWQWCRPTYSMAA